MNKHAREQNIDWHVMAYQVFVLNQSQVRITCIKILLPDMFWISFKFWLEKISHIISTTFTAHLLHWKEQQH